MEYPSQPYIPTIAIPNEAIALCQVFANAGGKAWLVGGAVRDMLLQQSTHDIDMEVYGLTQKQVRAIASQFGHTKETGKQFGITKVFFDHICIDIALPRTERKHGTGHQGFDVEVDPFIPPARASLRRDFTINAMMFDPLDHQLLDLHQGQNDLRKGILRHVSTAFAEDPLRPLRAMQMAARFKLRLAPETATICQGMRSEYSTLSGHRIWQEWLKWIRAAHPSYGLDALQQSGWLTLYSELYAMDGCAQEPRWHPEGDVWQHTKHCCDQVQQLSQRHQWDEFTLQIMMLSALLHDCGKPETSFCDSNGCIRSPGHAEAALPHITSFLTHIASPKRLHDWIASLVREHLLHLHGEPTDRSIRRLAVRLQPANIQLWEHLVEADASARPPLAASRPAKPWLEHAERLNHSLQQPSPIVTGKLLLRLGYTPGKHLGAIIQRAYQAQLCGEFCNEGEAVHWLCKSL